MKRSTKVLFGGYTIVVIYICLSVGITFAQNEKLTDDQRRTLETLRKIDDFPLYEMYYYGDYNFDRVLQRGVQTTSHLRISPQGVARRWACTCFAALNSEDAMIFGRNFDWHLHPALILFTNPPDGYASVSMVDVSYLGYTQEASSWTDRRALLNAPHLPFDGMNEYGLVVGIMAVPDADSGHDPQKVTIGSLHVVRLLLDYAQNVDEALSLLPKYNIDFDGGPPLHYLISDSSGNSALIEFVQGQMNVIRNTEPWQVSTNFVISTTAPENIDSVCWRYRKASEGLAQKDGNFSQEDAMMLLKDVAQSGDYPTIWSTVYNLKTGNIQVVMNRKYTDVHEFTLKMKRE